MSFPHHVSSTDHQFYHNLYSNPSVSTEKEKNEFIYKNQKFDFASSNSTGSLVGSENYSKDSENSKRFSVNNLLKSSTEPAEKLSGNHRK